MWFETNLLEPIFSSYEVLRNQKIGFQKLFTAQPFKFTYVSFSFLIDLKVFFKFILGKLNMLDLAYIPLVELCEFVIHFVKFKFFNDYPRKNPGVTIRTPNKIRFCYI